MFEIKKVHDAATAASPNRRTALGAGLAAAIAVVTAMAIGSAAAKTAAPKKAAGKKAASGKGVSGSDEMKARPKGSKLPGAKAKKSIPKAGSKGEKALGGPDTSTKR